MKKIITLKLEFEKDEKEMPRLGQIKRDIQRQLHYSENRYEVTEIKEEVVARKQ